MSDRVTQPIERNIIDQIESVYYERRTPGKPYVSDRRFLEFVEHHMPGLLAAARHGIMTEPEFTWSSQGPFTVQEQAGLPGDRVVFSAVDPSTGITTGAWDTRERAASDARALNAAYHLGRNHESHDAWKIVQAARDVHATRQDDACNDAPHSVHIDTNAAIALADAIEWYDTRGKP